MLLGHLPRHVRELTRADLLHDVIAGLALTALLVPAGMAYAQASGLPAVNGLYATIVPLVVYAIVGPSRVLVIGPDSTLAPLVLAAIVPLAAGATQDPGQLVALASMLAVLAGVVGIVASLLRMGFVADLLSAPVRMGYVHGIVLTIFASQLPKLFGFGVASDEVLPRIVDFVSGVAAGDIVRSAAVVGVLSFVVLVAAQIARPRFPATIVVVALAIVAVVALDLDGLALVGDLPQGLPTPRWPDVSTDDALTLVGASLGIAFVAFADTSVLSRVLSVRRGEQVDADRELAAIGMANVATGLLQGFPVSASSSRTPVAEAAGARTQVTGLVGALAVIALIVVAPGAFRNLPESTLAAVVLVAALRLVDIGTIRRLALVRRSDLVVSVIAFLGVAVLGPIPGIGVAVGISLLDVMRRAWRPHATQLVRLDGVKGYHDAERHPEGARIPGLVLYRFDAPLFFANAGHFANEIRRLSGIDGPGEHDERWATHRGQVDDRDTTPGTEPVRWIVVTAEPITDVDTSAAEDLERLHAELRAAGVTFAFAELKGHVRDQLDRYGLVERIGPARFYRTVGEAVRAYVAETDVDWIDWEDEPG